MVSGAGRILVVTNMFVAKLVVLVMNMGNRVSAVEEGCVLLCFTLPCPNGGPMEG